MLHAESVAGNFHFNQLRPGDCNDCVKFEEIQQTHTHTLEDRHKKRKIVKVERERQPALCNQVLLVHRLDRIFEDEEGSEVRIQLCHPYESRLTNDGFWLHVLLSATLVGLFSLSCSRALSFIWQPVSQLSLSLRVRVRPTAS